MSDFDDDVVENVEVPAELEPGNALRALIDLRETIQRQRIAFSHRVGAIDRGVDEAPALERQLLVNWTSRFDALETEIDSDIRNFVKGNPIINRMTHVKGCGAMLAAKVVCFINIERADTVSALWRYAGYSVTPEGTRERLVRGEPAHYNVRLKTALYLLAVSFLRCNSPYRRVYDDSKAYYEANRPNWTKAHRHQASLRRMIKMFLSHLWVTWRTIENLPTRSLYVEERLKHTHIMQPQEFGWPAL